MTSTLGLIEPFDTSTPAKWDSEEALAAEAAAKSTRVVRQSEENDSAATVAATNQVKRQEPAALEQTDRPATSNGTCYGCGGGAPPRRLPFQERAVQGMQENRPHRKSLPQRRLEWPAAKPAASTATELQSGVQRNCVAS
ncbi:hypothetical protein MTO96_046277 [Rhipicephalus appendiculatus]